MSPTFDLTPEGVTAALDALGTTPEKVADTLLAGGYRGQACNECACPVAEYLRSVFPGAKPVVTGTEALLFDSDGAVLVKTDLPRAVRHFVDRFDLGGHFVELVTTGGA